MSKINDDIWKTVCGNLDTLKENYNRFFNLTRTIGLEIESPLVYSFINNHEIIIKLLQILINDTNATIDWFVSENDFGTKKLEAGYKNNIREIVSYDDLRWLLELTQKKSHIDRHDS